MFSKQCIQALTLIFQDIWRVRRFKYTIGVEFFHWMFSLCVPQIQGIPLYRGCRRTQFNSSWQLTVFAQSYAPSRTSSVQPWAQFSDFAAQTSSWNAIQMYLWQSGCENIHWCWQFPLSHRRLIKTAIFATFPARTFWLSLAEAFKVPHWSPLRKTSSMKGVKIVAVQEIYLLI